MTVDTKKVTQRREVHYDSFDDLLADAERLANEQAQKRLNQVERGVDVITSIFTDLDIRKIKRRVRR